jgi:hypothetical protein
MWIANRNMVDSNPTRDHLSRSSFGARSLAPGAVVSVAFIATSKLQAVVIGCQRRRSGRWWRHQKNTYARM